MLDPEMNALRFSETSATK